MNRSILLIISQFILKQEGTETEFGFENPEKLKSIQQKKSRENPGLILITKSILHYFT